MTDTTTQTMSPLSWRTFVSCGPEGGAFVVRAGFATLEQAQRAHQFIVDAGRAAPLPVPDWFDMVALDVARRFTDDADHPKHRAALQVSVVQAMQLVLSANFPSGEAAELAATFEGWASEAEREKRAHQPISISAATLRKAAVLLRVAHPPSAERDGDAIEQALTAFEQRERGIPQAHMAAKLVAEVRAAQPAAQQRVPVGEAVAAQVRWRRLRTPARTAFDGQDHFSEWGQWEPCTLSYALAVTDPQRNTPVLCEMRLLTLLQPAQQVTPEQITAASQQVDKLQQAYLDGYEFDDGEHQHSPSEFESLLIHDAACGLLSDDEFVAAFVRWRNLVDGAQQVCEKGGDDTVRLDALARPGWELSANNDPECGLNEMWQVHRVSGGRNDREWTLIGNGATPRAAIDSALAASSQEQGEQP